MLIMLNLLNRLSALYGFLVIEQRQQVKRFNSVLKISIFAEDNSKHNRPHAHILLNNQKIGEICLDTWQIIDRENKLNRKVFKEVNMWMLSNKHELVKVWNKNNQKIQIEFLSY